ncbi:MAG: hypothetical protein ACRDSP_09965 [Pseudonocardiaceae bacterium]
MTRLERQLTRARLPVVPPEMVLRQAAEAVTEAVTQLWPGEAIQVGPQLPSVTNYVAEVQVGQRRIVAKYSVLGTSLVSIIRGVRGRWSSIEPAQREYIRDPHAQLAVECAQLELLDSLSRYRNDSPQAPEVLAYRAGVLFTAAAEGPSPGNGVTAGSSSY